MAHAALKPGDPVNYFEGPASLPAPGTVVAVWGTAWARLLLDDGREVPQAFVSSTPYQSPLGGNCMRRAA